MKTACCFVCDDTVFHHARQVYCRAIIACRPLDFIGVSLPTGRDTFKISQLQLTLHYVQVSTGHPLASVALQNVSTSARFALRASIHRMRHSVSSCPSVLLSHNPLTPGGYALQNVSLRLVLRFVQASTGCAIVFHHARPFCCRITPSLGGYALQNVSTSARFALRASIHRMRTRLSCHLRIISPRPRSGSRGRPGGR